MQSPQIQIQISGGGIHHSQTIHKPSHKSVASDSVGERQWYYLQSSLLIDGLQRLEWNRELDENERRRREEEDKLNQFDLSSPARARRKLDTIKQQLNEEWRQMREDVLIQRIGTRCNYFKQGTVACNQSHSELEKWNQSLRKQARNSNRPPPAVPPSHIFAVHPAEPIFTPDQFLAASTLQLIQSNSKAALGLNTPDIQKAIQLTLQEMSQRLQYGLLPTPVVTTHSSSQSRHSFRMFIDELEQRRAKSGPLNSASLKLFSILRRTHAARVIQQAFRRHHQRRIGRMKRRMMKEQLQRERAALEEETRLHHIRVLQAAIRTRIAQHQFKQQTIREARCAKAAIKIWRWYSWRKRWKQWMQEWKKTARTKSLLFQKLNRHQMSSIVLIQVAIRSFLCRRHIITFKRAMYQHRIRRQRDQLWKQEQQRRLRDVSLEESLVLAELYTFKELQHVAQEQQKERSRVRKKFAHWEQTMKEYFYKKRQLPKHWLPQTDRHSGHTYYFNLKTGAISQNHPLHEAVEELRKKQQEEAARILATRLSTLQEYEQRLQSGLTHQRALMLDQLIQAKRRV